MGHTFDIRQTIRGAIGLIAMIPLGLSAQYTDVINSNRPGLSVSAYAVGKNVLQVETGAFYEQQDHNLLETKSDILGMDLALRYGLLFEPLEIVYEGSYQNESRLYEALDTKVNYTDFSRNRLGLKYLIYDRYKNPERNKPNLYSWRANHVFQLKNLIPSVALYGGATFNLGENPFYVGDPTVSYRAMVVTQSRLTPRTVLILNFAYDRIGTDFPELSSLVSLSYGFRNPKWSAFIEQQGIKSDRYGDVILRAGTAYLLNDDFQVDLALGTNFKDTPTRMMVMFGGSYRFDFHSDPKAIEDQKAGENGGEIKKNSMKRKERKKAKEGKGAEDIDLSPSKKQLRQMKKEGSGNGEIPF